MLQVTTLFLLAGGSSVEVPVQTEVAALESSATLLTVVVVYALDKLCLPLVWTYSAGECSHRGTTASECLVQE